MSASSSFAIYLIIWWLVLFMVLPFGAKKKIDAEDIKEGQSAGAPAKPMMFIKIAATTLISMVVFAAFYFAYTNGMLDFRPAK